jgi:hypothetical protein
LTITNGVAQTLGGRLWEGSVSPQRWLIMRKPDTSRLEGQIDDQGTIRGQISTIIVFSR